MRSDKKKGIDVGYLSKIGVLDVAQHYTIKSSTNKEYFRTFKYFPDINFNFPRTFSDKYGKQTMKLKIA